VAGEEKTVTRTFRVRCVARRRPAAVDRGAWRPSVERAPRRQPEVRRPRRRVSTRRHSLLAAAAATLVIAAGCGGESANSRAAGDGSCAMGQITFRRITYDMRFEIHLERERKLGETLLADDCPDVHLDPPEAAPAEPRLVAVFAIEGVDPTRAVFVVPGAPILATAPGVCPVVDEETFPACLDG